MPASPAAMPLEPELEELPLRLEPEEVEAALVSAAEPLEVVDAVEAADEAGVIEPLLVLESPKLPPEALEPVVVPEVVSPFPFESGQPHPTVSVEIANANVHR